MQILIWNIKTNVHTAQKLQARLRNDAFKLRFDNSIVIAPAKVESAINNKIAVTQID